MNLSHSSVAMLITRVKSCKTVAMYHIWKAGLTNTKVILLYHARQSQWNVLEFMVGSCKHGESDNTTAALSPEVKPSIIKS